jgi:S-adenosylmethionine:tRNA-ribosyltransferase-isomerase (queuine synthetase)
MISITTCYPKNSHFQAIMLPNNDNVINSRFESREVKERVRIEIRVERSASKNRIKALSVSRERSLRSFNAGAAIESHTIIAFEFALCHFDLTPL